MIIVEVWTGSIGHNAVVVCNSRSCGPSVISVQYLPQMRHGVWTKKSKVVEAIVTAHDATIVTNDEKGLKLKRLSET